LLAAAPTFHKDIEPLLIDHCDSCHRAGGIAPMSFESFRSVRPWAKAIEQAVVLKKMPPWFADPAYGHFSNDPSLGKEQIETIVAWVRSGAAEGSLKDAPAPRVWRFAVQPAQPLHR